MKIFKGFVIVLAVVSVAFLIGCNSEAPATQAPAEVEQAAPVPAPAAVEEGAQTEEAVAPAAEEGTEPVAEEPKVEEPATEEPG